jgi:hypothetical protein
MASFEVETYKLLKAERSSNMAYLMHYGIKGMHWGIRRTPEQLGHHESSPKSLSNVLKKLPYKNFTKLQKPEYTLKHGGSCHDQTFAELKKLREMGYKPKAKFLMECSDNGQGGMTHSFVYYKDGKDTVWFENAWKDRAGIHKYNSINDIKKEFQKAHQNGSFGNKKKYKNLVWSDFNESKHRPGETLQQFVNRCLG